MENSNLRQTDPNAEKSPLSCQSDGSGITQVDGDLRRTIPAVTSIFLAKIEIIRASRGLEGLMETPLDTLKFCKQDLILTHQDKPELVEQVAALLNEDPSEVTLHIAICNGYFYRGVFVSGRLRRGRVAAEALKLMPWSEFLGVITEECEPSELKLQSI